MAGQPDPHALLRLVLGAPPEQREAALAHVDDDTRAKLAAAADWTPLDAAETHTAYQGAVACVAARYYGLPVRFADLVADQRPEHVVHALADLLANSLRHFPPPVVAMVLKSWGALAVDGLATAQPDDPEPTQEGA